MRLEILPAAPVLVEHEQVGVGIADVKMVVDAPLLATGGGDEAFQDRAQLVALAGLGAQDADDRAADVHDSSSLPVGSDHFRVWLIATAMMMIAPRAMSCWLNSRP